MLYLSNRAKNGGENMQISKENYEYDEEGKEEYYKEHFEFACENWQEFENLAQFFKELAKREKIELEEFDDANKNLCYRYEDARGLIAVIYQI